MDFLRKKPTNPTLLKRAKSMRQDPAAAEKKLWAHLRNRQLGGFKFRRQQAIEPFIADFFCASVKLIIELDGDRQSYDSSRTRYLERDGNRVMRFVNDDVFWHLDEVLNHILSECERFSLLQPSP
jgi:very-short-patch-repair endonuclease